MKKYVNLMIVLVALFVAYSCKDGRNKTNSGSSNAPQDVSKPTKVEPTSEQGQNGSNTDESNGVVYCSEHFIKDYQKMIVNYDWYSASHLILEFTNLDEIKFEKFSHDLHGINKVCDNYLSNYQEDVSCIIKQDNNSSVNGLHRVLSTEPISKTCSNLKAFLKDAKTVLENQNISFYKMRDELLYMKKEAKYEPFENIVREERETNYLKNLVEEMK